MDKGVIFELGSPPQTPSTEAASGVTATTAVLHGELNPGGSPTDYYFSYNQGASCTGPGSTKTPLDPPNGPGNPATGSIDIPDPRKSQALNPTRSTRSVSSAKTTSAQASGRLCR